MRSETVVLRRSSEPETVFKDSPKDHVVPTQVEQDQSHARSKTVLLKQTAQRNSLVDEDATHSSSKLTDRVSR